MVYTLANAPLCSGWLAVPWLPEVLPLTLPRPLLAVCCPLEAEPRTDPSVVVGGPDLRALVQSLAKCPLPPQF